MGLDVLLDAPANQVAPRRQLRSLSRVMGLIECPDKFLRRVHKSAR